MFLKALFLYLSATCFDQTIKMIVMTSFQKES